MTQDSNPNPEIEPNSNPPEETVNVEAQAVDEAAPEPVPTTPAPPSEEPKPASEEPKPAVKAEEKKATPAETPGTSDAAGNEALDQVKAVASELWRQAKPVLQKLGTQALLFGNKATDYLLDTGFPLVKEKFIQVLPADFKVKVQEKVEPVKVKVVPIWQKVWPWLKNNVGPLWAKAIAFIRSKLPADLSGQLSDRFLNVLVVTAVYLVWSLFSGLTHPSQAKAPESDLTFPEVKNKPSMTAPERTPRPLASPKPAVSETPKATPKPLASPKPALPAPKSEVPKAENPAPKPEPPKAETPQTLASPKPAVTPKPLASPKPAVTTPKAEAPTPATPKPLASPKPAVQKTESVKAAEPKTTEPAPKPAVPVKTGPDLVALKAEMVRVSDRVLDEGADIVNKVAVQESANRLTVELSDRWYKLSADDQTDLAEAMLSKSEKLEQGRLELRDSNNEVVARSPYVGDDMIILKRSLPAIAPK